MGVRPAHPIRAPCERIASDQPARMCGIVAFTGKRPALPLLLDGLRRLEYRGYDSAGVALIERGALAIAKRAGRVDALAPLLAELDLQAGCGIAHTRLATHGAATDVNAHPHTDETGRIALVHNGVIRNQETLRGELAATGHTFRSETDSELIVHLIEQAYQGDLRAAVTAATSRLVGEWALAVISADQPALIVGARMGAPLAVGLARDEQFLVSDPSALDGATHEVAFLVDGDSVELRPDGVRRFDAAGVEQPLRPVRIEMAPAAGERGAYASFYEKERAEQPVVAATLLDGRLDGDRIRLAELDPFDAATLSDLHFVACGSAHHATLAAASLATHLLGISATAHVASEFRYAPPPLGPTSLVVAVSQSGETADTLAAARVAVAAGARLVTLVNVTGSTLARESELVIPLRAGIERSVAATKSYLAQGLMSLLLVLDLATRRGRLGADEAARWRGALTAFPDQVAATLVTSEPLAAIATHYATARGLSFIGRLAGLPAAREAALKTKELSYLPAEAYPAGELKHGPIALLAADHPLIAVLLDDAARGTLETNLAEGHARGARLLVVGSGARPAVADDWIGLPATQPELAALLAVVALQRFALELARLAGREIDFPRNLAKSVTVE